MTARTAAWALFFMAAAALAAGVLPLALFLAFGAALVRVFGPTDEQLDAEQRQADPRTWHARPRVGR